MLANQTGARDARDYVLGDNAIVAEMRGNQVKGNLLNSRVWYLREYHSDAKLESIARTLKPEARRYLLEPCLAFTWHPMSCLMEIDRAIVESAMDGDVRQMRAFGMRIAEHDLPTLYRVLFKLGTPAFLLSKVSVACGMYFRESSMRSTPVGPTRTAVTLIGRRWPFYLCAYGVDGWFESAVRVSGGKNARARHTLCHHRGDTECRWDVSWT